MTQARGFLEQLLYVAESTYGTTPGTPSAVKLPFNTMGLASAQNLIDPGTITGHRKQVRPGIGNITVSGDIVVPVDVRAIGYWLALAIGTPTTSGTDPYTHTFKPGLSLPSAVLESGFSTPFAHYALFNGCKVNQMSFSFGGDGELVSTVSVMGAKETAGTSPVDADPTAVEFDRFNNFQASITEGGAAIATVTQLDLTINNGLDGEPTIGSAGVRADLAEGMMTVSGTLKALFADQALYNKAINNTESSIVLTLTSDSHSLALTLPEIVYERNGLERNGAAGVYVSLPFRAYYDDAVEETSMQAVLVNDVASYA